MLGQHKRKGKPCSNGPGRVKVRREGTFLWYTANTEALQELLNFLYAECCTRNKAVEPGDLVLIVQAPKRSKARSKVL